MTKIALIIAAIQLGSWNLKWFPSGRAEHRASARVENANIADAAETVRAGMSGRRHILFFQEVRSAEAATNLVAAIARKNLVCAAVSAFRERDRRLGWQQCAIATDLKVVDSAWGCWKKSGRQTPPRGWAYALIDAGADGLVACWCVHLKSEYGATTDEIKMLNRSKRERAIAELVEIAAARKSPDGREIDAVVIAGDFNTDPLAKQFEGERTVEIALEAGFSNPWKDLPLEKRGTHPGHGRWKASTIDYILYRGLVPDGEPSLSPEVPLSDHRMIWVNLKRDGARDSRGTSRTKSKK